MPTPFAFPNTPVSARALRSLRCLGPVASAALALLLAGCISATRAPVEDRSISRDTGKAAPVEAAATASVEQPVPAGSYRVKRGDTLFRIALENGQSYREIAQWNNLSNPNQIEVGQILRVRPPEADTGPVASAPVKAPSVEARPLGDAPVGQTGSVGPDAKPDVKAESKPDAKPEAKPDAKAESKAEGEGGDIAFAWPVKGQVVGGFDEAKNKGIDIAGKVGDPVRAAADGKVVYAGNGLRGYGNLLILKHDNVFLTAYGHNRALLVKEGEQVKAGQVIAEMGNSDADRVKLHFEIRRNGKPVDPARYLAKQ